MKSVDTSQKLWVEKFRPRSVEDCILPAKLEKQFKEIVRGGFIPNMLLHGGAGVGKTTVARAIADELKYDYIIINASEERGLDVIRNTITNFASTCSLSDAGKCIILDESDYLLPGTMAALRNPIEKFSKNCSFVFTANYPNRIIEPLHSRLAGIDFRGATQKDNELMQAKFFMRVIDILNYENVKFDEKVLYHVVTKFFPDCRKILTELQQYGRSGYIDEGILTSIKELTFDSIITFMKEKKYKDILQWCADNCQNDTSMIYEQLYKQLKAVVAKQSIPDVILVLEEYQRYDSIVASKELHLSAMFTQLMMTVEFA